MSRKKETTVVNKHHKVDFDVFIGRGSKWGNPFSHMENTMAVYKVETREQAISAYSKWIFGERELLASLKELKSKILGCYCFPLPCHGCILAKLADTTHWKDDKIILECSTLGDIRFSAFGAEIEIFGKRATIEEHYQLSKRFVGFPNGDIRLPNLFIPESIYDVKGKNAKTKNMELFCIVVNNFSFPPDFRMEFYKYLWIKYLDENPDLVSYLMRFDDYNDIFKGKSIICQADAIRQFIQQGRDSMIADVKDFCEMAELDIK